MPLDGPPAALPPFALDELPRSSPMREGSSYYNPPLQARYIRIEYHHHRNKPSDIVPLDKEDTPSSEPLHEPGSSSDQTSWYCPWTPFKSRADFEAAEMIVRQLMKDDAINQFLSAIARPKAPDKYSTPGYQQPLDWFAGSSKVSMRSAKEFHAIMEKARLHILAVRAACIRL
jgi:hypothetical protein